ncbi:hypothetical protein D3C87_2155780 [compost metagenome]
MAFNTSFQRYLEIEHPSEKERAIVRDLLDIKIQVSGGGAIFHDSNIMIAVHRANEAEKVVMNMKKVSYGK